MKQDLKGPRRTPAAPGDAATLLSVVGRNWGDLALPLGDCVAGPPTGNPSSTIESSSGAEICLGVIDQHPFTRECISNYLKALSVKVIPFESIQSCMSSDIKDFDMILYHMHGNCAGQQGLDEIIDLLKFSSQSLPVIILSDHDSTSTMMAAFENGARGYIPTDSTSVAVAVEAIRLVKAGGTFVPSSTLQMIDAPRRPPELTLEEPFTSRQMAVLRHLTQGKSNKIIAYELEVSESTVKVHVRNIMKKLRASNRTEVAFRAQNLSSVERQPLIVLPQDRARNATA